MRASTDRPRLYLAAPLFNLMERQFNEALASRLGQYFDVYLPQRDGGLMTEMIQCGVPSEVAAATVFEADIVAMKNCDAFLIILDGRTVDEGAAFELGYVFGMGKPCYGLQTDTRRLLPTGNNPMIQGSLIHIFQGSSELSRWMEEFDPAGVPSVLCGEPAGEKQEV